MKFDIGSLQRRLAKIQPILIWLIGAYLAYKLAFNGWRKFDPDGFWTKAFVKWGYPVWFRIFIGVVEFVGGLLMIVPRSRPLGALMLLVVMVGALSTRLIFGTSFSDALAIGFNGICFLYFVSYQPTNTLK